jgi:hypothetical protein
LSAADDLIPPALFASDAKGCEFHRDLIDAVVPARRKKERNAARHVGHNLGAQRREFLSE